MALPTFQSIAFQLDTSAASINVDVSSLSLVEGDALIVLTAEDTNPDGHTVSGNNSGAYTLLHESSSSSPSSTVAWKVQGAAPDTSVNVDLINIRATGTTGLIVKIPNVNVANPIDAPLVNLQGTAGMPNPPAVTTVTANAVRIITGHLDDDQTPVIAPSGFEQVIYNAQTNAVGGHTTVMIAFREEATPGPLDPGPFVATGDGDDEWWSTHFAVNLASAPSGADASAAPSAGLASGVAQSSSLVASAVIVPKDGSAAGGGPGAFVLVGASSEGSPDAGAASGVGQAAASVASIEAPVARGDGLGRGREAIVNSGSSAAVEPGAGPAAGAGSAPETSSGASVLPASGSLMAAGLAPAARLEQGATAMPPAGESVGEGIAPRARAATAASPPSHRIVAVSVQRRVVTVCTQKRIVRAA